MGKVSKKHKSTKEQKTAEGHEWVLNTARKARTRRRASAGL